jgi:predicted transcriptional regulator
MKKLPEAEFQVIKAIWAYEPPVTSSMIMEYLASEKSWRIQTVVALLGRLVEKGFLRSEKKSKERLYYPLVSKEDYLLFETGHFVKQYHENSFISLLSTLHADKELSNDDLDELQEWIKKRRND